MISDRRAWLAGLAMLVCGQVHAAEAERPLKLDWLHKPTASDMSRFYPEKAQREEQGGGAVVACDLDAAARLNACRVVREWPADYGFGEAALKLTSIVQIDPKSVDLNDPARNRLVMPIVFATPRSMPAPNRFLAGGGSWLVKVDVDAQARGARTCPSKDKPDRMCADHPLKWGEQPALGETLPTLEGVDMDSGVSTLLCKVSKTTRRLVDCAPSGEATPAARKAMLELSARFVAPDRTLDMTPVKEGPVAIPFHWSEIMPMVRALKRP